MSSQKKTERHFTQLKQSYYSKKAVENKDQTSAEVSHTTDEDAFLPVDKELATGILKNAEGDPAVDKIQQWLKSFQEDSQQ